MPDVAGLPTGVEAVTLTDFLLARIAEDEAIAGPPNPNFPWEPYYEDSRNGLDSTHDGLIVDPTRVLAECEAKRRIMELHREWDDASGLEYGPEYWEAPVAAILRALALPYADHPDYCEEWKV